MLDEVADRRVTGPRVNNVGAAERRGYGDGGSEVNQFIRAADVDPRCRGARLGSFAGVGHPDLPANLVDDGQNADGLLGRQQG